MFTAVAKLGFKRRATAVPNLIPKLLLEWFVYYHGKAFCSGTAVNLTELNWTSETKPCYSRATVQPSWYGSNTTFETGLPTYILSKSDGTVRPRPVVLFPKIVQSNLFNTDTKGTKLSVRIVEMSVVIEVEFVLNLVSFGPSKLSAIERCTC